MNSPREIPDWLNDLLSRMHAEYRRATDMADDARNGCDQNEADFFYRGREGFKFVWLAVGDNEPNPGESQAA